MPSVEMRRSTRVFVPKAKGGEFVRVLRSGRRLWVDSADSKHGGGHKNGGNDEWFPMIEDPTDLKPTPPPSLPSREPEINEWHDDGDNGKEAKAESMDVDVKEPALEPVKNGTTVVDGWKREVKVIRNVYSRKRKRVGSINDVVARDVDGGGSGSRKFGLHFVRRKRKKSGESSVEKRGGGEIEDHVDENVIFSIFVESFCGGCSAISSLLGSVLRSLRNGKVELAQVSSFLCSMSISNVFASVGIHFLLDRGCRKSRGVCRIVGGKWPVPMFAVDFSAVPLCFGQLHAALWLRAVRISCLCWTNVDKNDEIAEDDDESLSGIGGQSESSTFIRGESVAVQHSPRASAREDYRGKKIVVAGLEASKVGSRNVSYRSGVHVPYKNGVSAPVRSGSSVSVRNGSNIPVRSGVITRSASKRRRRSIRSRRARNPSHFVMQKENLMPNSDHTIKKNNVQFPIDAKEDLRRSEELRRSARRNSAAEMNVAKPCTVGLRVDTCLPQFCSANLLVVETDKCYRVEGAEVVLDLSPSSEWVLAVKKDGLTRYCLKVQKEMKLNTTNRFTHAIVWSSENGWKLEFPDRRDWLVFKELYKLCGEKNVVSPSPVVKIIPVPGVFEVINTWDYSSAPFERPESYIKSTSDELSRVLSSRTANYDMVSEDEVWLSKLNNGLDEANLLSEETFELVIDAFEKVSYCRPEDCSDDTSAARICLDLTSPEVAKAVYRYWLKKRKQKRAPLLRVFELNEQKRSELTSKPVLRKKRSLKRTTTVPPIQRGRGKDSSVLQALAAERNVVEEQNAMLRVLEVKASADRTVEFAILKRRRAQFLMENADLALYRATMALRIADAAGRVADSQQAAAHFLD